MILIQTVCGLAGSFSFLDEIDDEIHQAGLDKAIAAGRSPPVFDWLLSTFSYQGISDRVARSYMEKNGSASWSQLAASLEPSPSCPKLRSYWQYAGCGYHKGSRTCSERDHISGCPVPRHPLRNGRLNQTAYSLFLFVRDIADGDIVHWIDRQLASAAGSHAFDLEAAQQEALVGPLRNVHGVSDKVLTMALSSLLMGVRKQRPDWFAVGAGMMAIDTLVHNFLHRTGILESCGKPHAYGTACYADGGCAEIIRAVCSRIDARKFNPSFPALFPRFVQYSIWRYCAADGLDICNGNQIDDRQGCQNGYCQIGQKCCRKPLKT